jgi:hypothetical protein
MEAADNAEVVPNAQPAGPESMWSTQANPEEAEEVAAPRPAGPSAQLPPPPPFWSADTAAPADTTAPTDTSAPADEDRAWASMGSPTPPPRSSDPAPGSGGFGVGRPHGDQPPADVPPTAVGAPGAGGVFSAEPVERIDDVWDEDEVDGELEEEWNGAPRAAPVFSSGPQRNGADPAPAPAGASPFAAPADPWTVWEPVEPEPMVDPVPPSYPTRPMPGQSVDDDPTSSVAADQHGLDVAVSRLRAEDQDRARVPLSVCGALLHPGEHVIGAVTGQMLGRPAAVVVTQSRVLVVNDRRWQPIVDIYPIDDTLVVRGRHDRQVAALSFADDTRLSMVDGITEVDLAIALAETIREPGRTERGAGSAF